MMFFSFFSVYLQKEQSSSQQIVIVQNCLLFALMKTKKRTMRNLSISNLLKKNIKNQTQSHTFHLKSKFREIFTFSIHRSKQKTIPLEKVQMQGQQFFVILQFLIMIHSCKRFQARTGIKQIQSTLYIDFFCVQIRFVSDVLHNQNRMQKPKKKVSREKFKYSKERIIFFQTFWHKKHQGKSYYLVQCLDGRVFVGEVNKQFTLLWDGEIKHKITCLCKDSQQLLLYVGTEVGSIYYFNYGEQSIDISTIQSIDGKKIICITSFKEKDDRRIFTCNENSKIREYRQNKHHITTELPYEVNIMKFGKIIKEKNDIFCVFCTKEGFLFIVDFVTFEKMSSSLLECQQTLKNYLEKSKQFHEILSQEKITNISLSNTKSILAISTEKHQLMIYKVTKHDIFYAELQFRFAEENPIISLDVIEDSLLYITLKGIIMYGLAKRQKIAKNISFQNNPHYDFVRWGNYEQSVVYLDSKHEKAKMYFHQMNKTNK